MSSFIKDYGPTEEKDKTSPQFLDILINTILTFPYSTKKGKS